MTAFYNEIDPEKAEWIRELIKAGVVAPGIVDERSITELDPDELRQYTQCHFFAGIAVWSYALRLAGWRDDEPVWTGSCPCPSFSCAGKGRGFDDPRHLWPAWIRLICECRPSVIFGEQADDAIGYGWLDLVQTDLEAQNYAVGKAVLGACSVGAPHIRQRLYFVADNNGERRNGESVRILERESRQTSVEAVRSGTTGLVADTQHAEWWAELDADRQAQGRDGLGRSGDPGELGDSAEYRPQVRESLHTGHARLGFDEGCDTGELGHAAVGGLAMCGSAPGNARHPAQSSELGPTRGFWANAEWIPCRHPKVPGAIEWRPIKPGTFCLAHGTPARVLHLRGFGDAINSEVAAAWVEAYRETRRLNG